MLKKLRIVLAQINTTVGAIEHNAQQMIMHIKQAKERLQAQVIVFPELCLVGYPPEDLLFRSELFERTEHACELIRRAAVGITVIFGYPEKTSQHTYNAAMIIQDQTITAQYRKQCLPNDSVFDEKRYFKAGNEVCVIDCHGCKLGIVICKDIWFEHPAHLAQQAGAQLLICLNASPFYVGKIQTREAVVRQRVQESGLPVFYINAVGGQDELVFDGGSFVMDSSKTICERAAFFEEQLLAVDIELGETLKIPGHSLKPMPTPTALVYEALVLGVRDYIRKSHAQGVVLGLSGGIDSALTLCIAVAALGKDNVEAVIMPSRYTASMSVEDAELLARTLGVSYSIISIEPLFQSFLSTLQTRFQGLATDVTEQNMQSRCRGMILMAISNKSGKLVLTTGNKSEIAVGYSTLYGDTAGAFDVLKDVPKTLVYLLAQYCNREHTIIPERILTRAPSAELAPGQTDQDSLPAYEVLDAIIERYIIHGHSSAAIIEQGFDSTVVKKVLALLDRSEYKRRQCPPGVKISKTAFGRDWRYPLASGFHDK